MGVCVWVGGLSARKDKGNNRQRSHPARKPSTLSSNVKHHRRRRTCPKPMKGASSLMVDTRMTE